MNRVQLKMCNVVIEKYCAMIGSFHFQLWNKFKYISAVISKLKLSTFRLSLQKRNHGIYGKPCFPVHLYNRSTSNSGKHYQIWRNLLHDYNTVHLFYLCQGIINTIHVLFLWHSAFPFWDAIQPLIFHYEEPCWLKLGLIQAIKA